MEEVKDITVLNVDGQPREVAEMSTEVQAMVATFNTWNRAEQELIHEIKEVQVRELQPLHEEVVLYQSAKNDLARRIQLQISNEAAAETAAEEVVASEVTEDAPVADAGPDTVAE